jgi:hypothetical protein
MPAEWLEPSAPLPGVGVSLDRLVVYRGIADNLPAASSVPNGCLAQVTDFRNTWWYSDGTYWRPAGRQVVRDWWNPTWPTGGSISWSIRDSNQRLNLATQFSLPSKLLAPGTELRSMTLARKLGTTSTGAVQVNVRATPFTAETDIAGSFAFGAATASTGTVWVSNDGRAFPTVNNRLAFHLAWMGNTAQSPSAAIAESVINPFMGALYFCASAQLASGTSDTWEYVRDTLEVA